MSHNYVSEFTDSMNEHANAGYKAVPPYVVELERMTHDRGTVAVWRRPTNGDPREEEWGKVKRVFGDYEDMTDLFESLETDSDIEQWEALEE